MSQLIDHHYRGMAHEGCVEVKFRTHNSAIFRLEQGDPLNPGNQALRFETSVKLDVSDNQIDPGGAGAARRLQHGVGLADAGRSTEKYF